MTDEWMFHAAALDVDLVDHFGSFHVDGVDLGGKSRNGGDGAHGGEGEGGGGVGAERCG